MNHSTFEKISNTYHYIRSSDINSDEIYSCERREIRPGYYGLFATSNIKQGALIMHAYPVSWIKISDEKGYLLEWSNILVSDVFESKLSRGRYDHEDMLKMPSNPHRDWFESLYPRNISDLKAYHPVKENQDLEVEDLVKFKVHRNAFRSGSKAVIYKLPSFVNHSCMANIVIMINPSTLELRIFAVRDIKRGQELLRNYSLMDNRHRQAEFLMKNYKIVCQCLICLSESDLIWQRRYEEQRVLLEKAKDLIRSRPRTCFYCFSSEKMKRCSQCLKVWYCSKECQVQHWNLHKKTCCK